MVKKKPRTCRDAVRRVASYRDGGRGVNQKKNRNQFRALSSAGSIDSVKKRGRGTREDSIVKRTRT